MPVGDTLRPCPPLKKDWLVSLMPTFTVTGQGEEEERRKVHTWRTRAAMATTTSLSFHVKKVKYSTF